MPATPSGRQVKTHMKRRRSKTTGRNPFQDEAAKNQSPHWLKDEGKPGSETIPAGQLPHPFVDAKLTDSPPTSESAEGTSGRPEPGFEDEPADK